MPIQPLARDHEDPAKRGGAKLLAEWLGFTVLAMVLPAAIYVMIVRPLWKPQSAVRFDFVDDVAALQSGGVAVALRTSRQLQVFDETGQLLLTRRLDDLSPPYRIESDVANGELRVSVYTQKHSKVGPRSFSVPNVGSGKASTIIVRGLPFFQSVEIRGDGEERAVVQFGLIALIRSHPIGTAAFLVFTLIVGTALGFMEYRRKLLCPDAN